MAASATEWREIGLRPIGPKTPAGASARYEPDFEALEAEIQKLEGLSREPVNWAQVVILGRRILEQKSKDLLVCSYVAMGLLQTEGIAGLTSGFACLEAMVGAFWQDLFPEIKRMKARVNALNWLAAKASAILVQGGAKCDLETSAKCEAQARSLLSLVQEKSTGDIPDWTDLLNALTALATAPVPAPAEPVSPPTQRAPEVAVSFTPATTFSGVGSVDDARRYLADTMEPLKRALSTLRTGEPSEPMPYALSRAVIWAEIDDLPPATDGKTMVPAPPAHVRNRCQDLLAGSAWKELLDEAEDRIGEFPFWLDLHRMSDQALAALGAEYKHARGAVKAEIASLLARLPGLQELQFSDGTNFADESTQRWLSSELLRSKPQSGVATAAPGTDHDALTRIREECRQLREEGKLTDAISSMQEAIKISSSCRERFLIQLELAKLCHESGQIKPALALFEVLDEKIRASSLETWEPGLCVEVLQLYWEALNELARTSRQLLPETIRQADLIYNRLCNLDVLAGLHLAQAMRR